MKRNMLLVPLLAAIALLLVGFASAQELASGQVDTEFNGVPLDSGITMTGDVSDTVPVRVTFESDQNASDVRVKVSMEGYREDVSESTERFDVIDGHTYTKLLNLELPEDADDLNEEYTLYVSIVSKTDRTEEEYTVSIQRTSNTLGVLSVDVNSQISAGEVVPVSVVIENTGFNRADDIYVVANIPALGVKTRGYAGDLVPTEECDECEDEEDSVQKTVYLRIPENAESGVYEMEISVYNKDAEKTVTALVSVEESESSMVLAAVKNKDVSAGETAEYELILVNSGDNVKVYTLSAVSGNELSVSVPAVVTVDAGSSRTVPVSVTADSDAEEGSYTFSVDVDGEQMVFGANVTGETVSASVVALTVVLVIIFVVLLAVLIVLLTRKEKPIEEVETSYY